MNFTAPSGADEKQAHGTSVSLLACMKFYPETADLFTMVISGK